MEELVYREVIKTLALKNTSIRKSYDFVNTDTRYYKINKCLYYLIEQNDKYNHLLQDLENLETENLDTYSKDVISDLLEIPKNFIDYARFLQTDNDSKILVFLDNDFNKTEEFNDFIRRLFKETNGKMIYEIETDDNERFLISIIIER